MGLGGHLPAAEASEAMDCIWEEAEKGRRGGGKFAADSLAKGSLASPGASKGIPGSQAPLHACHPLPFPAPLPWPQQQCAAVHLLLWLLALSLNSGYVLFPALTDRWFHPKDRGIYLTHPLTWRTMHEAVQTYICFSSLLTILADQI